MHAFLMIFYFLNFFSSLQNF